MGKGYVGWALPANERARLLGLVPAAYERTIAHHVTLAFGVGPDHPLPKATGGEVVGIADDGDGVQALVVAIEGSTERPGGGRYHITWSLGPDRSPVESNNVIQTRGWSAIGPIPIVLTPRFFPL
jgi:hypothetical protein